MIPCSPQPPKKETKQGQGTDNCFVELLYQNFVCLTLKDTTPMFKNCMVVMWKP